MAEPSPFDRVLELARADDPECVDALGRFTDPELLGPLMVEVYRSGTAAGRKALFEGPLAAPFKRGAWQGFKRIYKLAEASFDAETFVRQARTLDIPGGGTWPVSFRTLMYMKRRTYRHFKKVALEQPDRFMDHLELLLPMYYSPGDSGLLLTRLLRRNPYQDYGTTVRFVSHLENPFAEDEEERDGGDELLDLDPAALVAADPPPEQGKPGEPKRPQHWKGPIFPELWLREPERLVQLLERVTHEHPALAITHLLHERLGERLLSVPLDAFYRLLSHPIGGVWRLALSQLAARARLELLRFDELVTLFPRAVSEGPDWAVVADLLYVLDDERAEAARAGLGPALRDLLSENASQTGVGPVVAFFRRHLGAQLGPPLFDWGSALRLIDASRPDVRELGRDAATKLGDEVALSKDELRSLLRSGLVDDDPELVHRLLTGCGAKPKGYRPPDDWPVEHLVKVLDEPREATFVAVRRALLQFEDDGGLAAKVAQTLLRSAHRRTRTLGLELFGAALRRGSQSILEVVELLRSRHEDVVVWARASIEEAAGEGRLGNEAMYRMLDAAAQDVKGFARELVQQHLRKFDEAELIVFCAESPDAATADLGISLYESELKDQGYDLRQLLPMFRILLYKVATARQEKERLFGTLRRWALEQAGNARLVTDVVAAFRRTEAKIDFARAMTLLVAIKERFGDEVQLPFTISSTFGHVVA